MKSIKTLQSILRIGLTTVIAGGINYFYHPLMLQFMNLETFGEFTSILWVFNILGVLTTGISLFLVQRFAQQKNKNQIYVLFKRAFPRCVLLGGGIFFFFLLLSPFLQDYLRLEAIFPLILVAFSVIFGFSSTPFSALLQGGQHFRFLWISGIVGAICKLWIGVGLAYLGFWIYAAIGGLLWGGVCWLLFVAWRCFFKIFTTEEGQKNEKNQIFDFSFQKELKNLGQMLFFVLLLSFFMNGDVILAKNLFDSTTAGIYGALAVIGKFVIFIGAAVETVYYPKIMQYQLPHKVPFVWLKNAFFLLLVCLVVAILGTILVWPYVLKFKEELIPFSWLLTLVVFSCSLYAFISLYGKILVAWKDKFVNWILLFGGLGLVVFLYCFPNLDLYAYVLSIAVVEFLVILCFWWRIFVQRSFNLSLKKSE